MTDVLLARGGFGDDTTLLRLHQAADLSVRTVAGSLVDICSDHVAPTHRSAPACVLFAAGRAGEPLDADVLEALCRLTERHPKTAFVAAVAFGDATAQRSGVVAQLLLAGADDVVLLDGDPAELGARVAARVRRVTRERGEALTASARPWVDVRRREAVGGRGRVELTAKEAMVLEMLTASDGVVLRDDIGAALWTGHWSGTPKAIDMHVANLRRKLPHVCGEAWRIETVRGAGFVLAPGDADADHGGGATVWSVTG